jgi:hypothetical protein
MSPGVTTLGAEDAVAVGNLKIAPADALDLPVPQQDDALLHGRAGHRVYGLADHCDWLCRRS